MSELDLDSVCLNKTDRFDLWISILNETNAKSVAEIGVWRGEFAAQILEHCPSIETYYMIDPWRHLEDWNKPANVSNTQFDAIMAEALDRTKFAIDRVKVLRGRTQDVVDQIEDGSLDFAYIDGDHSLRGITVDLQLMLPKVHLGGYIGGDDFCRTVWQQPRPYEPSFVFPYAVYFAEAMKLPIWALHFDQFLVQLKGRHEPVFTDRTGKYPSPTVVAALGPSQRKHRGVGSRRWRGIVKRGRSRSKPEPA
ncbi:MAG TPA: class I SAM-dependent methyltransferase [Acidimicrobiales bacterium]|nr:class I SAM-dependent methyltransferase [Acidimicrobiales bacterium]